MNIAIIILIFIVTLLLIVFFHELGHFTVAKRAGVKVEEFGIGLPPRIAGVKWGETIYSVNAIPLGAFVKAAGEDDPTVPRSLAGKGPWTRLAVYAAGPLVNILLAFILLSAFYMLPVKVIAGNGAMIHSVIADSPAEEAGIRPGDVILAVNGKAIHTWEDLQKTINSEGEEVLLQLQDGKEIAVTPVVNPESQRRELGILLCWNIIDKVQEGSPAYEAGIRAGDTILAINRQAIYSEEGMTRALASPQGEGIKLALLNEKGETIVKEFDSAKETEGMRLHWVDGASIVSERLSGGRAIYLGAKYVVNMPALLVAAIPMIKEAPGKAMVGPVGAGQLTVEVVRAFGFQQTLFVAAILSLGIGLFNLFPLPPLDGGGMLVAFIEGVRRGKRLSPRAVRLAYSIGTALLIALVVIITFNDILRLIKGGSFML